MKRIAAAAILSAILSGPAYSATLLYSQDFESPVGFVNDGGDVNIHRTINQLYSGQPAGFTFSQTFTVETLLVGGTQAHGVGFDDPQNIAGSYVVSMLSSTQDDLLGLAFDVGAFQFLNFSLNISSIDLGNFGGPFVPPGGAAPTFRFSLFDNPSGVSGIGAGTPLDFEDVTGAAGPNKFTFNWTNALVGLDAAGNTNGNVILRIDLLSGGYAAMDNFVIAASDIEGEVPPVPEPQTYALTLLGLAALGAFARRGRRQRAG
jgi:hypothetical protein